MKEIIFNGDNGDEIQTFIEDNNLEFTKFYRGEGEVYSNGVFYKAPFVLMIDPRDGRNECVVIPERYYDYIKRQGE